MKSCESILEKQYQCRGWRWRARGGAGAARARGAARSAPPAGTPARSRLGCSLCCPVETFLSYTVVVDNIRAVGEHQPPKKHIYYGTYLSIFEARVISMAAPNTATSKHFNTLQDRAIGDGRGWTPAYKPCMYSDI